jgi:hypothetical protein
VYSTIRLLEAAFATLVCKPGFPYPAVGLLLTFDKTLGQSSNHALFWSLTASIANLGHRSSRLHQEPLRSAQPHAGQPQLPRPPSSKIAHYYSPESGGASGFPSNEQAMDWISSFFDAVGAILPYVNEPGILDGLNKLRRGTTGTSPSHMTRALLYIVFAHALSPSDSARGENYYRQTLSLLDPKTLYTPTIELRT